MLRQRVNPGSKAEASPAPEPQRGGGAASAASLGFQEALLAQQAFGGASAQRLFPAVDLILQQRELA